MPRHPDLPCADCGQPMWRSATPRPPGQARCRPCRRQTHGVGAYSRGCRCDVCHAAVAAAARDYRVRVIERDGVSPTQKARPRKPPIYCPDCGRLLPSGGETCQQCGRARRRQQSKAARRGPARRKAATQRLAKAAAGVPANLGWPWVQGECASCGDQFTRKGAVSPYCSKRCSIRERSRARRAGGRTTSTVYRGRIFDRDQWRCQLCRKKVKRDAVVPHPKAPTLDHILPLSVGGTDESGNLQLACFRCNSIKSGGTIGGFEQLSMLG